MKRLYPSPSKRRTRHGPPRAGVGLFELLIGIGLLALVVGPLLGALLAASQSGDAATDRLRACELALAVVERYRSRLIDLTALEPDRTEGSTSVYRTVEEQDSLLSRLDWGKTETGRTMFTSEVYVNTGLANRSVRGVALAGLAVVVRWRRPGQANQEVSVARVVAP